MEHKSPETIHQQHISLFKVFLAGTIDMGNSEDWQAKVVDALDGTDMVFINPRRDNWDSTLEQTKECDVFVEQVEWELSGLELADAIFMYFHPDSKSPVSLLELGLHLGTNPDKLVVCCPDGFYRKGNVDITCEMYGAKVHSTVDEAIDDLMGRKCNYCESLLTTFHDI